MGKRQLKLDGHKIKKNTPCYPNYFIKNAS